MSVSTNRIKTYIKEQLIIEIQRFITVNVQLVTDKMETERTKVNLETDKVQLLKEKNFLIVKKEELRTKIATMNAVGFFNLLVRSYQDPLLRLV